MLSPVLSRRGHAGLLRLPNHCRSACVPILRGGGRRCNEHGSQAGEALLWTLDSPLSTLLSPLMVECWVVY
jgi:hypothetical protein